MTPAILTAIIGTIVVLILALGILTTPPRR